MLEKIGLKYFDIEKSAYDVINYVIIFFLNMCVLIIFLFFFFFLFLLSFLI